MKLSFPVKLAIALAIAMFAFLVLCAGQMFFLEAVATLAFGWFAFLLRVIPALTYNPAAIASALLFLTGSLLLTHLTARWLRTSLHPASPPWKLRYTFALLTLLTLMFSAGAAATGIAHQTGWLLNSPVPLVANRRHSVHQVKCASNLRQLHQALLLHAQDHNNRLPDTLEDLLLTVDIGPLNLICPGGEYEADIDTSAPTTRAQIAEIRTPGNRHLSYLYYGRGLSLPLPHNTPLISEPLANHQARGFNLLTADGEVTFHPPHLAPTLLPPPPTP